MENKGNSRLSYLTISPQDEGWGTVVTTVGCQFVPPGAHYPLTSHPDDYNFNPRDGRVLREYQLVYITRGEGIFTSSSCRRQKVSAGSMILLFPGEWHDYYPDPSTGWDEYWIGFRGAYADSLAGGGFFSPSEPVLKIGVSATLAGLYEDVMGFAFREKPGHQQVISGIVYDMLGRVYYKARNNSLSNTPVADRINAARLMMKENAESPLSPLEIASRLGLGYSWFRRVFRQHTGVSPAQYQLQQRFLRAKELLTRTGMNISEIAYRLKFENAGQFSTFFRRKEGVTPSEFRKRHH